MGLPPHLFLVKSRKVETGKWPVEGTISRDAQILYSFAYISFDICLIPQLLNGDESGVQTTTLFLAVVGVSDAHRKSQDSRAGSFHAR